MRRGQFNPYGPPGEPPRPLNERPKALIYGRIVELNGRGTADVRALTGEFYRRCALPGASIIEGAVKGNPSTFRVGQRVLIAFEGDAIDAPVVVAGYPLSGTIADLRAAEDAADGQEGAEDWLEAPADDADFPIHHPSGYRVRFTDSEILIESANLDKTISIDLSDSETPHVSIGGKVKVANGDALKEWMDDVTAHLKALSQAITETTTVPTDGGASYKAGLSAAVQMTPAPDVPDEILDTNLTIDESGGGLLP